MGAVKTKLPPSVQVGNARYQIKVVPELEAVVGATYAVRQLILIEDGQGRDYVRDTVLHEVLHAAFNGIDTDLSTSDEERLIRWLTPVLLAVLRGNKQLVRWLQER